MWDKWTLRKLVLWMICASALAGCVRLGKNTNHITFVHSLDSKGRSVELFRVADKLKVDCETKDTEDGKAIYRDAQVELQGKVLIRPDVAIAKGYNGPRIRYQVEVQGIAEGTKEMSFLKVGGWYVMLDE